MQKQKRLVDAKFTLVCGKRGSGKTNKTIRQLFKAVSENNRKVLVYDVKNEFGDYLLKANPEERINIKPMALHHVQQFSVSRFTEIRRIAPFLSDGSPCSTDMMVTRLIEVFKNFRGGILLTEDLSNIITDSIPGDIYGALATLRQAGVDVIAHFQMVGKAAHPKMIAMANYIRLHKTEDSVDRHRDKFGDKADIMLIAEKIVEARYRWGMANDKNDETGKYFNVTIDVDYSKIRGIFTRVEAEHAITEFISQEGKINKLLKQKNRFGQKVYDNYQHAHSFLEQRYMDEFFVFNHQKK
jgi:hypothetical protein